MRVRIGDVVVRVPTVADVAIAARRNLDCAGAFGLLAQMSTVLLGDLSAALGFPAKSLHAASCVLRGRLSRRKLRRIEQVNKSYSLVRHFTFQVGQELVAVLRDELQAVGLLDALQAGGSSVVVPSVARLSSAPRFTANCVVGSREVQEDVPPIEHFELEMGGGRR